MMRIVVLSDSHRNKRNLYEVIERHLDNADLFLFLGDGESDFEDAALLYPKMKYDMVAGNCDFGSTLPLYKEIICADKRVFFTHGHPFYVKHGNYELIREAQRRQCDIALYGHTHTQYAEYLDGLYIMNPGSIASGEYGVIDIVRNGIMMIKEKI